MANCKYTLTKGMNSQQTFDSYEELLDGLASYDTQQVLDILFSMGNPQGVIKDKLESLKQESILKATDMKLLDGSPDLDHDPEKAFTTQTLIDSTCFSVDGKDPIFKLNTKDYINTMKQRFVESGDMSTEEAEKWGSTVQSKWDLIAKNATDFHSLILEDSSMSFGQWAKKTADTAFAGITDKVIAAEARIFQLVYRGNGKDKITGENVGMIVKNLNLETDIRYMAQKLLGHIDYVMIKPNGDIELFNVKTSIEPYSQWSNVKREKYRYQLALLKQMLAFHGIDTRNIQLNIIPTQLVYDDKFEFITDIRVQAPEKMEVDSNNNYIFRKYDHVASQFVDSSANFTRVNPQALVQASADLQHIFPGKEVSATGIAQTAKEWITANWGYMDRKEVDGKLQITFPDSEDGGPRETVLLTDRRKGANNEELVKYVQDRISQEVRGLSGEKSARYIRKQIENAYTHANPILMRLGSNTKEYIMQQFSKYFDDIETDNEGHKYYKWELVDSPVLEAANMIAFRHHKTGQLDLFVISGTNPGTLYVGRNKNTNLLSAYIADLNMENFTMPGNYGNIDAVRGLVLLNQALPSIGGDIKLGQLKVIGMSGYQKKKGAYFEFDSLLKEFDTIVRVVNRNANANIKNNFRSLKIQTIEPSEVVRQIWEDITSDRASYDLAELRDLKGIIVEKIQYDGSVVSGLMSATTLEAKINKLEALLDKLTDLAKEELLNVTNHTQLIEASKGFDTKRSAIAKLYIAASQALSAYSGDIMLFNEEFSSLQEYLMKVTSIGNSSVRRVAALTLQSIDNIRSNMVGEYMDTDMPFFQKYYDACGYTKTQNALIGNQVTAFKNLFQLDENGKNLYIFKNPYDPASDLKSHEREFLKNILFQMYKYKCRLFDRACDITGVEDSKLKTKMPKEYLWVPLQRASKATMRTRITGQFTQWKERVGRMFSNPEEAVEELYDMLSSEDIEKREQAIDQMRLYNPYTRCMLSIDQRNSIIAAKGEDYFETNVENIFIDFMTKQIQCEEFNKLLIRIRGIELSLRLRGIAEGDDENIQHTINTIDKYVSLNVYNKSIMEPMSKKIDMWLDPFRKAVSSAYIAGNLMSAFRDGMQGIQANFLAAATKFYTDINLSDVIFGYKKVMEEGVTNLMSMSMLNQFNIKYAFSNFDAAHINERLKTGRGGFLNAENWAYWTLRAPDYLNRMVLFIAQLHHDGAFDAYSLNENHRLKYDWRKDKRYAAYASGNTSHPDYNKQRAKYMSQIRAFNLENPSLQLAYTDDLPDAYTPMEIRRIKVVGENIYGSYDLSTKALAESTALGRNFMVFFTWMNGMQDVYFKSTQTSNAILNEVQETDYDGQPLYWEENGTGNMTTRDTGLPVTKHVLGMVQGIIHTFGAGFNTLYKGGWSDFKKDIWSNRVARMNARKAFSDLGMILLCTLLFKLWLTPKYKEHKAHDDGNKVLTNVFWELMYKGAKNSYDVFLGPIALMEYFGEQTSPASYALQAKLLSNTWNVVSGQKNFGAAVFDTQAFLRSMKDSYAMYMRDSQQ